MHTSSGNCTKLLLTNSNHLGERLCNNFPLLCKIPFLHGAPEIYKERNLNLNIFLATKLKLTFSFNAAVRFSIGKVKQRKEYLR